jgi:hypothetical protein
LYARKPKGLSRIDKIGLMHEHYLKRGFFNNNLNMNTTDKEVSARSDHKNRTNEKTEVIIHHNM